MIWDIGFSGPPARQAERLRMETPSRFEWLNLRDMRSALNESERNYASHEFWEQPSLAFPVLPTARLRVDDPTFSSDFLSFMTCKVASARLRSVLGDDPAMIRYRPIDTSASVPEVQRQDYAMFDVLQYGNPFDPARARGTFRNVRQADGSMRQEFVFAYGEGSYPDLPVPYFRDDFVPPAPIFRATGALWTFVTDELAERILRAGITGVLLLDISPPYEDGNARVKTLP